jgi:hypothetical protein
MDVDWEVEIGGDAPVIEAQWSGLIDLRTHPQRIDEIFEVSSVPQLGDLLLALNSENSPVWTSKCDVWEPEPNANGCYVDMLPREPQLFGDWKEMERFCQAVVRRIAPKAEDDALENPKASRAFLVADGSAEDTSLNLIIRRAVNGGDEGFGITAYFAAANSQVRGAKSELGALMGKFLDAMMDRDFPAPPIKAKIRDTGE